MSAGATSATSAPAGSGPPPAEEAGPPAALRSARRAGLIDQVIEQLRDRITSGAWPVGSRIPTESELSTMTATSRNTVREAVQSLVHSGLLERRQGSGTYVLAASELAGAVSRRVAGAQHRHVLEVRRTLEVGAARLAAARRTDADVVLLEGLLARRSAARLTGDLDGVVSLDVALHRAIAQATHNPVLAELYENLCDALTESVRANVESMAHDDDHAELVRAIVDRDAERAAAEAAGFFDDLMA
jgi:DNA-binding FadR family transcriptional regulator